MSYIIYILYVDQLYKMIIFIRISRLVFILYLVLIICISQPIVQKGYIQLYANRSSLKANGNIFTFAFLNSFSDLPKIIYTISRYQCKSQPIIILTLINSSQTNFQLQIDSTLANNVKILNINYLAILNQNIELLQKSFIYQTNLSSNGVVGVTRSIRKYFAHEMVTRAKIIPYLTGFEIDSSTNYYIYYNSSFVSHQNYYIYIQTKGDCYINQLYLTVLVYYSSEQQYDLAYSQISSNDISNFIVNSYDSKLIILNLIEFEGLDKLTNFGYDLVDINNTATLQFYTHKNYAYRYSMIELSIHNQSNSTSIKFVLICLSSIGITLFLFFIFLVIAQYRARKQKETKEFLSRQDVMRSLPSLTL